jgi:hypothetical protein
MKCPKCKYVSHDYLDVCRKCGVDLVAFKHDMGLLVLQPGVLDLSLVLGAAGANDLFESVEEEVTMHAGNDDDFDISLDDPDQPGVRRAPVGVPRAGGLAELASMLPPHVPETAATPAEKCEMAESIDEAHAEGLDDGASAAAASEAVPSLQLQDIVLAEDTPAVPEEQGLEIVDVPSPEEVSLWPVLELAPDTSASAAETTLPGHLTLELDASEIIAPWSSMTLDDLRLDDPPGDVQSHMSPPQHQAGDEEALLLDLDDVEFDDDTQA